MTVQRYLLVLMLFALFTPSMMFASGTKTEQIVPDDSYKRSVNDLNYEQGLRTERLAIEKKDVECGNLARSMAEAEIDGDPVKSEKLFRTYDSRCLGKSKDVPAPLLSVVNITGVLQDDSGEFCSGFFVSKDTVMTARHCIFEENDSSVGRYGNDISQANITFLFGKDLNEKRSVVRLADNEFYNIKTNQLGRIDSSWDYVFLKVNQPVEDLPKVEILAGARNDKIFIYGYFGLVKSYLVEKSNKSIDYMRWSKSTACIVGNIAGKCIYHGCSTEHGFSGAPIISQQGTGIGIVKIVGIHVADTTSSNGCDPGYSASDAEQAMDLGNVGIKLSSSEISNIRW